MPPRRRGRAVVKKAKSKYIVVDLDFEEVSDGELSDQASRTTPEGHGNSEKQELETPRAKKKSGSVPRKRRSRQGNTSPVAAPAAGQSKSLAQTLFPDYENTSTNDHDDSPSNIRESIEVTVDHVTNDTPLKQARRARNASSKQPSSQAESNSLVNRTRALSLDPCPSSHGKTSISEPPIAVPKPKPPPTNCEPLPDAGPIYDSAEMAHIPTSQARHMRACMVCSIVRTYTMFLQSGCPNCDNFLELTGNSDAIQDCTSQVFEGLLTVSNTSRSWVARYQRLEGYVPGVYAIQVEGILPEDAVVAAEQAGVHYIPRDGSVSEALPTEG